jgi:chloramphenicol 3-O phosphotransferase
MNEKPWIIFLNGTSSAGKSSIAFALQELFVKPALHIGVDTFLFTMPPRYLFEGRDAHLGYNFIRIDDQEGAKVVVQNGPYAEKINHIKRQTMKSLLEANFNLIIDEVLYADGDYQAYQELFKEYPLTFVGMQPPVEVAVERERVRGDRMIGLARGLHSLVHINKRYDLTIDSSKCTPEEAARKIYDQMMRSAT